MRWAILLIVAAMLVICVCVAPGFYFHDKQLALQGLEKAGLILVVAGTALFWVAVEGGFDEQG